MFPTICYIGPIPIRSFGLMMALAVLVCSILLSRDAKKVGIASNVIFDLLFACVIGGLLGARIFFILLNFSYYIENPVEIFYIQRGGLAWQGGLIIGGLTGLLFIKKKNWELAQTLDLLAPYIALGQAIGRLGCFLNGCCYGRPVARGIYFPVYDAHLHPTQLYSSIGLLAIFFVLRGYQKKAPYAGSVFVLYLILAASWRFMVEFFRADHNFIFLGLSVYQWVCAIILGATIIYARLRIKDQRR